jgi:hypothetical protein
MRDALLKLAAWQRDKFKTFCKDHSEALQTVTAIDRIEQHPSCTAYDVTLECGCKKVVTVAVRDKHSSTAYKVPVIETGLEGTL